MEQSHLQSDKFCVFRSGESWFALPALAVREVSFRPDVVPVPLSDPALIGLCHIRNEFIPAVSFQLLWGDRIGQRSAESQMLVLNEYQTSWALLIDQVVAMESLETSFAGDGLDDDRWSAASLGWATFQEQPVRVLHSKRLYRLAENVLESFWTASLKPPVAERDAESEPDWDAEALDAEALDSEPRTLMHAAADAAQQDAAASVSVGETQTDEDAREAAEADGARDEIDAAEPPDVEESDRAEGSPDAEESHLEEEWA